jgi:hypothetical protein
MKKKNEGDIDVFTIQSNNIISNSKSSPWNNPWKKLKKFLSLDKFNRKSSITKVEEIRLDSKEFTPEESEIFKKVCLGIKKEAKEIKEQVLSDSKNIKYELKNNSVGQKFILDKKESFIIPLEQENSSLKIEILDSSDDENGLIGEQIEYPNSDE